MSLFIKWVWNFDFDKLLIDNDNQYINDNNYYLSYKNSYLNSSKDNYTALKSLISEIESFSSYNCYINIESNIILFNSNISNLSTFNNYKFMYKQLILSQRLLFDNFIEYNNLGFCIDNEEIGFRMSNDSNDYGGDCSNYTFEIL